MTVTQALTTTYETGGTSMRLEAVAVAPDRARTPASFESMLGGQLNPGFVADFLSAALAHEQCGRHLYRSVAGRTQNPMLKRRYESFGAETEEHVGVLQELIVAVGGDPGYVSPSARATEKLDHGALESTFMLDGSTDLLTRELVMLDAVVLAETTDTANWEMIEQIGESLHDGPIQDAFRRAVDQVRPQEDDHVMWATQTRRRMLAMLATSPTMAGLTATMEQAVGFVRDLFADD